MIETDSKEAVPLSHPRPMSHLKYYRPNLILHFVFLLIAAAIIFMSFAMSMNGPTDVRMPGMVMPMPESCIARRVWGQDCPGCGLTRSFISMSDGKFVDAFRFNGSGPLVYFFVSIQIPWHLYQIGRILKRRHPVESVWLYSGIFFVSGAMFLQWFVRLF